MIDFTKLTGVEHDGKVVTQIEDSAGRVLWAVSGGKVILQVEKITSDTYAAETTYTGEQFILFDIYPKTNGTVSVTYGGLTKTITDTSGAEEPNAQQVYFGTFNGVSDEVTTPESGVLTIEGNYRGYGLGSYSRYSGKTSGSYLAFVTNIIKLGNPVYICDYAFYACNSITNIDIPASVTSIGLSAFYQCGQVANIVIPSSVTSIGNNAFYVSDVVSGFIVVNRTIVMLSTIPPTLGMASDGTTTAFTMNALRTQTIIVPKGCGEVYKTADGWKTYANVIVEAS